MHPVWMTRVRSLVNSMDMLERTFVGAWAAVWFGNLVPLIA